MVELNGPNCSIILSFYKGWCYINYKSQKEEGSQLTFNLFFIYIYIFHSREEKRKDQ